MDVSKLVGMAEQLREQLGQAQQAARQVRAGGEAGGGLVRVVMDGQHQVVEVKVDPSLCNGDVTLLEDLIRAAVNQSSANVASALQQRLGSMAQSMGLDLGGFGKPKV